MENSPSSVLKVAVIGGGWAGCAAAVELARHGCHVTLFEAARTLGGRARCVEVDGMRLDNGQHILLGAYRETLRLMRTVGIDERTALLRLPLQMRYPQQSPGMEFIVPRLPAPFHLLVALWRARGLSRDDKMAMARFSTTARWMDWHLDNDCTVSELLARFEQTPSLIQLLWRPLCIAALNTPPERASAQVFLNVLRDSLGANRAASDMLVPRSDLSMLFPQQAAQFVQHHGGSISCGSAIRSIQRENSGWRLASNGKEDRFDAAIVATPPNATAMLLDGLIDTGPLQALGYEPITTCYLQYSAEVRLPHPFLALVDEPELNKWGQFVFDRGALEPAQAGLLAVVVSASSDAIRQGHEALTAAMAAQLAEAFKLPQLAQPRWARVISEKRATFSCTPSLQRPSHKTGLPGLFLAGDYCASDYPATLESAVRSGVQAAQALIAGC